MLFCGGPANRKGDLHRPPPVLRLDLGLASVADALDQVIVLLLLFLHFGARFLEVPDSLLRTVAVERDQVAASRALRERTVLMHTRKTGDGVAKGSSQLNRDNFVHVVARERDR